MLFHPKNRYQGHYDFSLLVKRNPELKRFVKKQKGRSTIDFANNDAVKQLNRSLVLCHYALDYYDIPEKYLCPSVPGRADFIHHLADYLKKDNSDTIRILDIGVGANCIYPIIGTHEYGWEFVGTDIDKTAVKACKGIIAANPRLQKKVEIRHQSTTHIFDGIIASDDYFDATICNPPFYKNDTLALKASKRKYKDRGTYFVSNGTKNELTTKGGEVRFVLQMLEESQKYNNQIGFFTCLISNQKNLKIIQDEARQKDVKFDIMAYKHGHKAFQIAIWKFR